MVTWNGMAPDDSTNTPEQASLIQLKVMAGNKEARVPEGRVHSCTKHKKKWKTTFSFVLTTF